MHDFWSIVGAGLSFLGLVAAWCAAAKAEGARRAAEKAQEYAYRLSVVDLLAEAERVCTQMLESIAMCQSHSSAVSCRELISRIGQLSGTVESRESPLRPDALDEIRAQLQVIHRLVAETDPLAEQLLARLLAAAGMMLDSISVLKGNAQVAIEAVQER